MTKKKTPFGIIMDLLQISLVELSKHLYIDRTTISKWRSGGRRLLPQSPYFESAMSFFVTRDNENSQRPLIHFLSSRYPEMDSYKPEQVYEYLQRYLCSVEDTDLSQHQVVSTLPQQQPLIGEDGRKQALDWILSEAEKRIIPGTIKILELGQMSWLCKDVAYLQKSALRLKQLADRGFHIDFAFSSLLNKSSFLPFMSALSCLRFHKSIPKYIVDTERIKGLIPCIYLLEDECLAVGLDSFEPSIPIHTNLFSDSLNVYKYAKLFDLIVQFYGNKILVTDSGSDIDTILQTVNYLSMKREDFIFYGEYLSITTMSQPLLLELLTANNIQGNARERCLTYYKSFRQLMSAAPHSNYWSAYHLRTDMLEKALTYEYLIDYELSALTNQQVRKTPAQYRQHLHETVEFFKENENVKLMLLSSWDSHVNQCTWLKRSLWSLSFNNTCIPSEYQVIFWDNVDLVNLAMEVCDHFIKSNYTIVHKQREYNLKVLQSLANGDFA